MMTIRLNALACIAGASLMLTTCAKAEPGALREVWTNVPGSQVHLLESVRAYPDSPVMSELLTTLEAPSNWSGHYGQRISTLLMPTVTGDYTFYIAGDDNADLWLSTDTDRQNAGRIAQVTTATGAREWGKNEEQRSEPIPLVAGQSYYLEILHKEYYGSDSVAVAWSRDGALPSVIGSPHLTAVEGSVDPVESGLWIEAGASSELFAPALSLDLGGQVFDQTGLGGSYVVQWSGGSGVEIDTPSELDSTASFSTPGSYQITLTVTKGNVVETDTLDVTVHPKLDPEAGHATQQFWFDQRGTTIEDLTSHLEYPLYPHMTRDADALQGPTNFHYYYGTRTVGYLLAPRDGDYRFYLSGDDAVLFSLSSDAQPANAQILAEVTSATSRGDFFVDPDKQISEVVSLVKGQRYFFELLHKEHSSSDHHAVFWGSDGDNSVELIGGEFLAPYAPADTEVPEADTGADYILYAGRDQTLYMPDLEAKMEAAVIRRRWNAELVSQTWSAVGPNSSDVYFADPTDPETEVDFLGEGTYTLRLEVVSDQQTIHDDVQVVVRPALAEGSGLLTREVWFNRYYETLDDLRASEEYPEKPHIVDSLAALSGPVNWSSLYGTRVTGWLHAPQSGDYTFYMTGDDEAEFRISSDDSQNNLTLACRVPSYTSRTSWFTFPEQQSEAVNLVAGERYFVELIHREKWSSDHFQVAWTIGDDRNPQVIEGSYFTPAKQAPEFRDEVTHYAYAGPDRAYYWPHDTTSLDGTIQRVRSSEAEVTTRWEQVSGPVAQLTGVDQLEASVAFPSEGRYVFRLTTSSEGTWHSDEIVIEVLPQIISDTGTILRSVWLDVVGDDIEDLLQHDPLLAYPDFEDLLPGSATPEDWGHYYGTRLLGYLNVPIGGEYTFWIAANDKAELWLGQDSRMETARRIAYVSGAVSPRRWDYRDGQESEPITLSAGRYFIEARHKEHSSGDHLALAWSGPATNGREPISRGFLSPARSARPHDPNIQVVLGPDRVLLWPEDTLRLTGLVYDLQEGPEILSYTWSHAASQASAEFSDPNYPGTDVSFPSPGIYQIVLSASDGAHTSTDEITVTVQDPLDQATGSILREVYTDIAGYYVRDLTAAPAFPDKPTFRDTLTSFDTPVDWAENYGTRLRGYIRVPETDDYTLFIASDDTSELWFNAAGSDHESKTLVASAPGGTGRYRWDRYESQRSQSFRLEAGVSYFVEALHKSGVGGDYLTVAWRRGNDEEAPVSVIQGPMLIPFQEADALDEAIAINAGEDISLHWPFESLEIRGTAMDLTTGPLPLSTSWDLVRGTGVEIAAPNSLRTELRFPGPGKFTFQLTATDGQNTRTDKLVVRVEEPLAPDAGSLLCEIYNHISGARVTDLLNSDAYPNAPDSRTQLKSLEIPENFDDAYGARIRGYLHPHMSGVHRFNISGDDWAELYLSTDASPENKQLLCFTPYAVGHYEWLRNPEYQVSRPIVLKKGEKYYIEARLKDHSSRDHLAVAWHTPRSDHYEIVPGANLSPLTPLDDSTAPVIQVQGAADIVLTVDSEFVDPGIVASDDVDGDLTSNVLVSHNIDTSTPGEYTVRYRVVDAAGNESDEIVRRVRVVLADSAPAVYPADGSGNHPTGEWVAPAPAQITDLEASRFLLQASFGPSEESIAEVKRLGFEGWIDAQMAMPPSLHLPELDRYSRFLGARSVTTSGMMPMEMMPPELPMAPSSVRDRIYVWWTHAIKADDQLRQRIAFALSEILVISDRGSELSRYPRGTTNYYDLLVRNSFGNYRDLLEGVSVNPMMGIWLTHLRSSKESPDENYPRELMQLFSIGLHHLNQDGTHKVDNSGVSLRTYDQGVINELSRALTGWTYGGSQHFYYTPNTGVDSINPMIPFEAEHDRGAKTLLGGRVLPAGQTAMQDLQGSLDNVFEHPNVAPFICRRLIQRLVTSNPSPAYVYRVSGAFNDNGEGVRGDLGAVVKAILLDPEAREITVHTGAGKVREPMLRLSNVLRACYQEPSSNPPTLGRFVLQDQSDQYGQAPLSAPTVFNFFEPDYSLPGELVDAGLYSPEFQIVTELTSVDMANHMFDGIYYGFSVRSDQVQRIGIDLTRLESLCG